MLKVTLSGPAGCGKTTLAYVIKEWAEKEGVAFALVDEYTSRKTKDVAKAIAALDAAPKTRLGREIKILVVSGEEA